jgi:hypothetical protein
MSDWECMLWLTLANDIRDGWSGWKLWLTSVNDIRDGWPGWISWLAMSNGIQDGWLDIYIMTNYG